MARPKEDLTSKIKIAKHLGISRPQLDKYIASRKVKGHKVKGSRHLKYSLSEIERIYQGRDKSKSPRDGNGKKEGGDYWKWKAVTEQLKAEKLELELSCQRGELTETAQATKTVANLCRAITDGVYAAQDRLAAHLDHKTARRVRKEFDKALEGISTSAEKAAAALAKIKG